MIQFIIPDEWSDLYNKLLNLMVDNALDVVKDCSKGCDNKNIKLIECWNLFQSACCANSLNLTDKANFLYNFVVEQINLTYGSNIPDRKGEENFEYATDEDIDAITND